MWDIFLQTTTVTNHEATEVCIESKGYQWTALWKAYPSDTITLNEGKP